MHPWEDVFVAHICCPQPLSEGSSHERLHVALRRALRWARSPWAVQTWTSSWTQLGARAEGPSESGGMSRFREIPLKETIGRMAFLGVIPFLMC